MQSKKRAKPVKFGEKNKKEQKPVATAEKDEPKIVENSEAPIDSKEESVKESEQGAHGLEAHISRTTETIDIKEISDDSEKNPINDQATEVAPGENLSDETSTEATEDNDIKEKTPDENPVNSIDDETSDDLGSGELSKGENKESDAAVDEFIDDSPVNNDGAFFNRPPDDYDKKKSSVPYFIMIVVITFILGVVFFSGIYYAVQNKTISLPGSGSNAEISEAPVTEAPTKEPLDLSQYTIQVLNGTGTSGVAANLRDQLSTEGFKIGSIGNAQTDDFERTEISASKKVNKEFIDKLKETLGKTYVIGEVTELASGSADVIITIGSETAD